MRKRLRWAGIAFSLLLLGTGLSYLVVSRQASAKLSRTPPAHRVDVPVPFPLTEAERAQLAGGPDREPVDVTAVALERAIARGKHLVEARFLCAECHGADFGGGVMVDDPAMGSLLGPNLTSGEGSVTTEYTMADWDRIVRHGIRKDGRPALMPSEDFAEMSDRELSDIVAYVQSLPPVDRVVPPSTLGPVGKILLVTGKWLLSVDRVEDHDGSHSVEPPDSAVTTEFGAHLARVCVGCHRDDFEGGPIAQGPPSWAPASNLTPHDEGLAEWSYADFARVLREGKRPDGNPVQEPMTLMTSYGARMTETELRALWLYLKSLPPRPTGA